MAVDRLVDGARGRARSGALAGGGAFLAGYAVALEAARRLFGGVDLAWGSFLFYNAHLVPLTSVGGVTSTEGNAVLRMFGSVGLAGVAVPALLLAVAGGALAWRATARSVHEGAGVGAAVTAGYLPLSALGALVSTGQFFGGVYRPALPAAIVAGVVFPVVFGGVGGALVAALHGAR